MTPPELSIILPCYNEAAHVAAVVAAVHAALEGLPHEVIVVDDGSTDGSGDHVPESARLLRHQRNLGYGAAIKTALRAARAPVLALIDADGTYPAPMLRTLFDTLQRDALDMAVAARQDLAKHEPPYRRTVRGLLTRYAAWLSGGNIPDLNSGLRVVRADLLRRCLPVLPEGFSLTTTLTIAALRQHAAVAFVPIDHEPRGELSKVRPVRDALGALKLVLRTGLYFAPLRVFGPLVAACLALFVLSAGYDVFVLQNLTDKTVLMLVVTLFGGVLAVLADMIAKRLT